MHFTLCARERQKDQSLSSFSTAIKASVGTCTLPRFRIFFLPVEESLILSQVSFISIYAAGRRVRCRAQEGKKISRYPA